MSDTQTAAADAGNPAKQPEAAVDKSNEMSTDSHTEKDTKSNGDSKEESKNDKDRYYRPEDRRGNRRGGGGRGPHYPKRNDNEFDNLPESDDPAEIREQVEFYFSPQNLSMDRHMFVSIGGSKNHPVDIKHITSFKRMRRFKPYSAVVKALRESKDLVVVDDGPFSGVGNEGVKRKEPIEVPTEEDDDKYPPTTEELFERYFKQSVNKLETSVYVKGFGDLEKASQIEIEKFFKPFGAIMVRRRFDKDTGRWKGSVFVEMDSEESQQQFLALDPKPKFNGNELTIMSKKEYSEMKCKEKGITPAWEKKSGYYKSNRGHHSGGGRGRGHGGHGGRRGGHGDRRDNRHGRDRSRDRYGRDRSPRRRRYHSDSESEGDKDDWNGRRDRFQKSRGKRDRDESKGDRAEKASPTKRKADDAEREEAPKKSKVVDIKEDE